MWHHPWVDDCKEIARNKENFGMYGLVPFLIDLFSLFHLRNLQLLMKESALNCLCSSNPTIPTSSLFCLRHLLPPYLLL